MKYAWIDSHRREFALSELCEALKVSISGYRASKRGGVAERKGLTDLQMLALSRPLKQNSRARMADHAGGANCNDAATVRARTGQRGL